MDPNDVKAYMQRDWAAIQKSKQECWLDLKKRMTPTEIFEYAASLADYVRSVRPDWPSERERDEDRAAHIRLSETLRRAENH